MKIIKIRKKTVVSFLSITVLLLTFFSVSAKNKIVYGEGEDCISDSDCGMCNDCINGVCFYSPPGAYCYGCTDGGCGATTTTCTEGGSCTFSEAGGSCKCNGAGVCSHAASGWWCEPTCPVSVSSTCTVVCGACGNPKTCSPDGGGGGGDPGCGTLCSCNCNMDGIFPPEQVTTLYTPTDGMPFTSEIINFSWAALPNNPVKGTPDAWGFNSKWCGNGTCENTGGFSCPSGSAEDGEVHEYELSIWSTNDVNTTPLYTTTIAAPTTSVSSSVFGTGAFSSCGNYYWAVRAKNTNPLDDDESICLQMNTYGPWSPVRSFRTNCPPLIISVTPSGGVSGRYAYDGTIPDYNGFSCNDNNPTQFELTVQDPDGVDDINLAGIWISDISEDYNPQYYSNSIHTLTKQGSYIYIVANGTQAFGIYPQMGLYINNNLVQIWNNIGASGKDLYRYYSKTPVKASDIKVSFMNDAYNPVYGEDRNLTEIELYLNGIAQSSASLSCTIACTSNCGSFADRRINGNGSECWFQYNGSTLYGQNTPSTYGLKYINTSLISGGINNWKNYHWSVPTNGYSVNDNSYITTMLGEPDYSDSITSDLQDTEFKGHIKLISVNNINATTRSYRYEVIFGGDNSSKIGNDLKIYGYVSDYANARDGWTLKSNHELDFRSPEITLSSSVEDKNNINVDFRVTDSDTGVSSSKGYGAFLAKNPLYNGETGFLNTVPVGMTKVDGGILGDSSPIISSLNQIWNFPGDHPEENRATINITNVEEAGEFNFGIKAVDNVCNVREEYTGGSGDPGITLGSSWIVTKGGLAYSRAGYESEIQNLLPASDLLHSSFIVPYNVKKGETNISTELLASGNSLIETYSPSPYADLNPSILKNMSSSLVVTGNDFWTEYRNRFLEKYRTEQSEFAKVEGVANISGNTSTICPDSSKKCVVDSNNDLTVNANLVCDRKTLLIIPGNLTIQKQISLGNTATELDGCIFLVKGVINIEPFGAPVPADVEYDKIEGFFISADQIHIFNDNASQPRGLKVNGSLIGLGTNAVSVRFGRTLQLKQNLEYPSAVMHYDARYLIIAREFFGERSAYRKDSGFKPF